MPLGSKDSLSLEVDLLQVIQNLSFPPSATQQRPFLSQQSKTKAVQGQKNASVGRPFNSGFSTVFLLHVYMSVFIISGLVSVSLPYTTQLELKYAFMRRPRYIYSLMSQIAQFPKDRSFDKRVQYTFSNQLNIFKNSSLVRQLNLNFQRDSKSRLIKEQGFNYN